MDMQEREARDHVKAMPFSERVKYFWHYYKLRTIVITIIVIAAIVFAYNRITAIKYDVQLAYYGKVIFSQEQAEELVKYLETVADDINGDGEVHVNLELNYVDNGEESVKNNALAQQKFMTELYAGYYSGYIVDENYYEIFMQDEKDKPLESSFDLRESKTADKMLGPIEKPLYWCTKNLYEIEKDKEKKVKEHESVKKMEQVLKEN